MPRLVRRQPLAERIKAYLNPLDFLLWLSEEFDSNDWDQFQQDWATPIGAGINIIFLIARANSGNGGRTTGDDVFGEERSGSGWLSWFVRLPISPRSTSNPCADIQLLCKVFLHRPSLNTTIAHKRLLHLLPKTPLPTLRSPR